MLQAVHRRPRFCSWKKFVAATFARLLVMSDGTKYPLWTKRVDDFCKAWSSKTGRPNYHALASMYAPEDDIVIYDTFPPLEGFRGFEQMRRDIYPNLSAIQISRVSRIYFKSLCAASVVITSYQIRLHYGYVDGSVHDIAARISQVWERREDGYRIVHEHPSTTHTPPTDM